MFNINVSRSDREHCVLLFPGMRLFFIILFGSVLGKDEIWKDVSNTQNLVEGVVPEKLGNVFVVQHEVILKVSLKPLIEMKKDLGHLLNSSLKFLGEYKDKWSDTEFDLKEHKSQNLLTLMETLKSFMEDMNVTLEDPLLDTNNITEVKRRPSSLLPVGDNFGKSLFGTAIEEDLALLQRNEENMGNIEFSHGKLLERSLSLINKNFESLVNSEDRIRKIEVVLNKLSKLVEKVYLRSYMDDMAVFIMDISLELQTLGEALSLARRGRVSESLLDQTYLRDTILNTTRNTNLRFPGNIEDMNNAYLFLSAVMDNNVVFITIPFSTLPELTLMKLHVLPVSRNNSSFILDVAEERMAVAKDKSIIVPVTDAKFERCYESMNNVYICDVKGLMVLNPTNVKSNEKVLCSWAVLHSRDIDVNCRKLKVSHTKAVVIEIQKLKYISLPPKLRQSPMLLKCHSNGTIVQTKVKNSGILKVADGCTVSSRVLSLKGSGLSLQNTSVPIRSVMFYSPDNITAESIFTGSKRRRNNSEISKEEKRRKFENFKDFDTPEIIYGVYIISAIASFILILQIRSNRILQKLKGPLLPEVFRESRGENLYQ